MNSELQKHNSGEIIKITELNGRRTVNARELHQFLESKREFANWIKSRIEKYGFSENQDYVVFDNFVKNPQGGRPTIEYALSIDMAKELSMVENNAKGRLARRYFIECEKIAAAAVTTPSYQIEDPIARAERWILEQKERQALALENKEMKPKAEYFDHLIDRKLLTNLRDTAKELNIGQNCFIKLLIDGGYIYRSKHGLRPMAKYANDLFEIKDAKSNRNNWVGVQTLVTPKGKETFRLLYTA